MNRAVFLLPRPGASTASQETPVDPDPGLSAPDVSPPKARRSRSGVRGLLVVIACCGVLMWATRTLWDSQHPAIAAGRGLEARQASSRIAAIRHLASVGTDDSIIAIPPLIARLGDTDADVRAAAADALGLLGSSAIKAGLGKNEVLAAMTGLVGLLSDQQPAVRIAAVNALGSIANCDTTRMIELEPAANALVPMLDEPITDVRASVIGALGFIGPRVLVEPPPAIVAALEDESVQIRAAAVASLTNYTRGLPRLIPSLLDSMHRARPDARAIYAALFGYIKPPTFSAEAIRPFTLALGSDDREIRYLAVTQLQAFGPGARDAIPFLIKTLAEPMEVEVSMKPGDEFLREPSLAAFAALGKIAPGTDLAGQAAAALAEAIRSGAPACRATSIQALTHFGPEAEAVIPILIAEVRASIAAETTEDASDPKRDPYPRSWQIESIIRALCAIAPGTSSADKVVDVLAESLQSQSSSARFAAADAVSRFGPEAARAIPQLRALQSDPDPDIRRTAAQALKELKVVD
jgi:HEAT repeat protein